MKYQGSLAAQDAGAARSCVRIPHLNSGRCWFFELALFTFIICLLAVLRPLVPLVALGVDAGYTPEGKLWALNEGGAPFQFALDEAGDWELSLPT